MAETSADRQQGGRWKIIVPAIALLVVAIGGFFYWRWRQRPPLTEKDTIVLADFVNTTRDPVFDEALKQALTVQLEQSPFLNVLSGQKLAETLRLMGRSPGEHMTQDLAREVCQRSASKAVFAGSISGLGTQYVIGLNAINCNTGDSLAHQQVQATGKEDVLKALGQAASEMRGKLGESLSSIQKFDSPVEQVTTTSLEALKAYSLGVKMRAEKEEGDSIPFFRQAIERDPNFAAAYAVLGIIQTNLGQSSAARENFKKAYELRDRVSERERYRISAYYYGFVTGELEKSSQTYELWKQNYPRDFVPHTNLGFNHKQLGQWEKTLAETQEAIRLEPNNAINYGNLAFAYLALNRPDEAKATLDEAFSRKLDQGILHAVNYFLAFLQGNAAEMEREVGRAMGKSDVEDLTLSTQSDTEAYYGRLRKAREFSQRAEESARRVDARERAALWQAKAALREAEFGNPGAARQNAQQALASSPGVGVEVLSALALAGMGDTVQAEALVDKLSTSFPVNTVLQGYWLPTIRATIQLHRGSSMKAVELLQAAAPYDFGAPQPQAGGTMYPVYIRGSAYLLEHKGEEAAAQFRKIIEHRGIVLNTPLGALARLGLARAYALQGDASKARSAYQDFLALWKDADSDIPILQQAKAEYAKLR